MIRFLIEKEFKLIKRNKFLPRLIVMMPMMMMLLLPFAANLETNDINLAVVDSDHSTFSAELIAKTSACEYFNLVDFADSYDNALHGVESGLTDMILEIPDNFQREMVQGDVNILIAANAVNATKGSIGSSYLSAIVQDFVNDKRMACGLSRIQQRSNPVIKVLPQYRFNPRMNYKVFMVPALMVMLLTIMCGFMPALNIVGEKESGTIEQMNVTPVPKLVFIASKLIPYWIIGFVVLTLSFVLAWLLYGLIPVGSYATIYAAAALFVLVMSGFGLLVSNHSQTMQQAQFVMFFFILIMLLISGLFTPLHSMPGWAQNIALFNPLKYFIIVMRGVYLKGSTMSDVLSELGALALFALFFNSWAVLSYRKKS